MKELLEAWRYMHKKHRCLKPVSRREDSELVVVVLRQWGAVPFLHVYRDVYITFGGYHRAVLVCCTQLGFVYDMFKLFAVNDTHGQ